MIAIVGYEEFENKKASWIPQNTRINTSWAVRVWSELSGRRNTTILSLETMRQFPKSILRFWISLTRTNLIIGSANSSSKFKLVSRRNFMSSSFLTLWEQCQSAFCVLQNTPARQKQQSWNAINGNENFYGNKFPLFFFFGFVCIKSLSRGIYTDKFLFNSLWIQFISLALPCYVIKPCPDFQFVEYSRGLYVK